MKTIEQIIAEMREGLDEMAANQHTVSEPEWMKVNAIRFMENYRIMRMLELNFEDEK